MAPVRTMVASGECDCSAVAGDRLSALPDCLLHVIMSFLKARQAVQTCVLSRRWVDLWCSMPCLDIDQQEFCATSAECYPDGIVECGGFENFTNNLLMFHEAPLLDRFRLRLNHNYKFEVGTQWVRRGIKRCPSVVEIYTSAFYFRLPHFGSSSRRLKSLHLCGICLEKSFTQELSFHCPVLEDLELTKCMFGFPEITSCRLKDLMIVDCSASCGRILTITAPALSYLRLVICVVGGNWDGLIVNDLPSLVKASVCLESDERSASSLPEGPCNLLCSLTNARYLELSGSKTLAILEKGSSTFPTFHNMRTLLFDGCDLSDNFHTLGCFLNNAPVLEKLALQYCKLPEGSRKRKTREHPKRISLKCQDILNFECPNLKQTEIKYKQDDVHQLFDLLCGIWRNLQKTTIVLNKG